MILRRPLLALTLILLAGGVLAAPAAEAKKPATLRVMTRNIYLGTDLIPLATQPNRAAFEQAATRAFNNVKATDFAARAKLLAREIKRTKPDLIGLQEVALWRTGSKDGVANNERTVAFDWLALLRSALKRAHLKYKVGGVQNEVDISGPTSGGFDVRFTQRDAILVKRRKGLKVKRRKGRNYKAFVSIPVPAVGRTYVIRRGWILNDVSLGGRAFRFLDTHLEAYGDSIRLAQARELVAPGGPANTRRRVILVGDLNSDPNGDPGGKGDTAPYNAITGFGFLDTWKRLYPRRKGYECCLKHKGADGLPDLLDPPPFPADHRIDHVLKRGARLTPVRAKVIGTKASRDRTSSGLWESDHGGVVTTFKVR